MSLGKKFFDTQSHEFELGVEPKWVNRPNISCEEANSLDVHPDYRGVEFDFRDMKNADEVFKQVKLFNEAIKSGNLSSEEILKYARQLELLQSKLGGIDLGELIKSRTPLTDEQLYRSGVNAHKVLRDVDGKPIVAIPNHPYGSYKHSNGVQIEKGKYSTIALSPNTWIVRKAGKIAQSPYALHRHEFNQYGGLNLPNEADFRNWERSPLNHHTQARFKASLAADWVFNQLGSDKAKVYGAPRTREEIEAEEAENLARIIAEKAAIIAAEKKAELAAQVEAEWPHIKAKLEKKAQERVRLRELGGEK